ncbi:hypothetical protein NY055_04850 [Corynebacterium diphtheriae bv. mitis]|nr:hypothetical protein NY055_04850 [Corynebacterium diphtheriae bv. mitis]
MHDHTLIGGNGVFYRTPHNNEALGLSPNEQHVITSYIQRHQLQYLIDAP